MESIGGIIAFCATLVIFCSLVYLWIRSLFTYRKHLLEEKESKNHSEIQ